MATSCSYLAPWRKVRRGQSCPLNVQIVVEIALFELLALRRQLELKDKRGDHADPEAGLPRVCPFSCGIGRALL